MNYPMKKKSQMSNDQKRPVVGSSVKQIPFVSGGAAAVLQRGPSEREVVRFMVLGSESEECWPPIPEVPNL